MLDTCAGTMEIRGAVSVVCADNLGSHSLGGFKQGGRALRFCRHCLVASDGLQDMVSRMHNCITNCSQLVCINVELFSSSLKICHFCEVRLPIYIIVIL